MILTPSWIRERKKERKERERKKERRKSFTFFISINHQPVNCKWLEFWGNATVVSLSVFLFFLSLCLSVFSLSLSVFLFFFSLCLDFFNTLPSFYLSFFTCRNPSSILSLSCKRSHVKASESQLFLFFPNEWKCKKVTVSFSLSLFLFRIFHNLSSGIRSWYERRKEWERGKKEWERERRGTGRKEKEEDGNPIVAKNGERIH